MQFYGESDSVKKDILILSTTCKDIGLDLKGKLHGLMGSEGVVTDNAQKINLSPIIGSSPRRYVLFRGADLWEVLQVYGPWELGNQHFGRCLVWLHTADRYPPIKRDSHVPAVPVAQAGSRI